METTKAFVANEGIKPNRMNCPEDRPVFVIANNVLIK